MVDRSMRGLYPILATPFDDDGRVAVEDLQREVEFALDCGAHGLGIALASEIYKLSEAERDLVSTTVVQQVGGRVPVVVNTGAPGTDLAVEYSRRAQELGANAVMAAPPSFAPASGEELREYFRRIAEAIDIPIFIQDAGTGPVAPALAAQIAHETEPACYAKMESPPTPSRIAEAVRAGGEALIVFGGAGGSMLIEELRRGSVGTMPHTAFPDLFRSVWDRFQEGNEAEASREFNRFAPLLRILSEGGGVSSLFIVKEVLRLRGIFSRANVRHPATPLDELTLREVRDLVESLDLASARVS